MIELNDFDKKIDYIVADCGNEHPMCSDLGLEKTKQNNQKIGDSLEKLIAYYDELITIAIYKETGLRKGEYVILDSWHLFVPINFSSN